MVFDLGNDLDILAIFTEDTSDVFDVVSTTDERGKDHVDSVLHTEPEVALVFLRKGWKVNIRARKVDAFLGSDLTVIECSNA